MLLRTSAVLSCLLMLAGASRGIRAGVTGLPDAIVREALSPKSLPQGAYTPVLAWEAEKAGHKAGRRVDDADAERRKAWELMPGTDQPEYALYGPYLEAPPGIYVAFYRIKLMAEPEDEPAATLDACVSDGREILTSLEVPATDLRRGKYVQVPVGFRYGGGKLECRLHWTGLYSLRIDRVSLFRFQGDAARIFRRVPEAVPTGRPKDLPYCSEPRPFPDLFPRSAEPAKELLVCDLRKERPDVRIALLTLQGLVNRRQPRIYCLYTPVDQQWLDHMLRRGWIKGTKPATPPELLARFRDVVQGVIITDPALPASKNIATMLASVKGGLVTSATLARRFGLPVVDDLRGRWSTSVDAYRWAFDNLWPQLNHHVIACSWPNHLGLHDYLVANKVFIFWLSGAIDGARSDASPDAEVRLMEELLGKMPANIPVLGYPWAGRDIGIGEGPGVSLFAEFGKYLVGSIDATNLTVHSGIRVASLRQRPAPPPPKLDPAKVYITWILSDGDNLPVLTSGNFPQLWADKTRGQFPIGWTISPAASMLIPDVADYYFSTETPNDVFLGAVSGVGYTYPDLYGKRYANRRRVYDEFLAQTAQYLRRSDLRAQWIMNATRPETISRFAEQIPFLEAIFPDYERRINNPDEATYPTARNVPVFHAVTSWAEDGRKKQLARLVADVRRMTPHSRPAFLHLFALNWFADLPLLREVLRQLGPEYVAVRPDHLAQLYGQYLSQERILVRFPESFACIEGHSFVLRGTVRNVSPQAADVRFRILGGMHPGTVTPDCVRLEPAQETALAVSGEPTADVVQIEFTGSGRVRRSSVPLHRVPAAELLDPLPRGATLTSAAYFEGENLAHRSGKLVTGTELSGGGAWAALKGQTEPGAIIFGPYYPLPKGKYVALFRLRRTDDGAGVLALLDTCVGGGAPQTGRRELRAEELPRNQWRWAAIPFDHPGGPFESRVQWSGTASLQVDAVGIWRQGLSVRQ